MTVLFSSKSTIQWLIVLHLGSLFSYLRYKLISPSSFLILVFILVLVSFWQHLILFILWLKLVSTVKADFSNSLPDLSLVF